MSAKHVLLVLILALYSISANGSSPPHTLLILALAMKNPFWSTTTLDRLKMKTLSSMTSPHSKHLLWTFLSHCYKAKELKNSTKDNTVLLQQKAPAVVSHIAVHHLTQVKGSRCFLKTDLSAQLAAV